MKVAKTFVYNEKQSMESNIRRLEQDTSQLFEAFKGRIRFGTGTDGDRGDNISGEWQVVTSADANTEFEVTHGLGAVPIGFLVINVDKGSVIYDSGTAWTATSIFLKATEATTTMKIFLLK
jgi:hypothetical protein